MDPIICSNDAKIVIKTIEKYLQKDDKTIKDIQLVEANDTQIVFLVDAKPMQPGVAQIWWSGYAEGMKTGLG